MPSELRFFQPGFFSARERRRISAGSWIADRTNGIDPSPPLW
jgi:hypothetical protein